MNFIKKNQLVLVMVVVGILAAIMLYMNQEKNNILGVKLFAENDGMSISYKSQASEGDTIYLYMNDGFVKGTVDGAQKIQVGTLTFPITEGDYFKYLFHISYRYLGVVLIIVGMLMVRRKRNEQNRA